MNAHSDTLIATLWHVLYRFRYRLRKEPSKIYINMEVFITLKYCVCNIKVIIIINSISNIKRTIPWVIIGNC